MSFVCFIIPILFLKKQYIYSNFVAQALHNNYYLLLAEFPSPETLADGKLCLV